MPINIAQAVLNHEIELRRWAKIQQTCRRKAVGAMLLQVTDHVRRLGFHHNGAAGVDNHCTGVQGGCGCVHAEPRAIIDALRRGYTERDCVLISSYSPCTTCANLIAESELVNIVIYNEFTEHDPRGVEILQSCGISVLSIQDVQWAERYWGEAPPDERTAQVIHLLKEASEW